MSARDPHRSTVSPWRQCLHAGGVAWIALTAAAVFASLSPLLARSWAGPQVASDTGFPGWPADYEGRPLTALPLSAREALFVRDFPGRVGRFSDGQREIILRWVREPTRRLHPASDCLRGIGYAVTPQPLQRNAQGQAMGCFLATRGPSRLHVCEILRDVGADATSWPDVSAWYWSALFARGDRAGWWSVVVAEQAPGLAR